jgi:cardiolipin synthase
MRGERVLGADTAGPALLLALALLVLAVVAVLWPEWVAVPLAAVAAWFALNLVIRGWRERRHASGQRSRGAKPPGPPPSVGER